MRFDDAWERLDKCHQQAICDVWEVCNIGNHDSSIGRCTVPAINTFIGEFKKWVKNWHMAEAEQNWFDANPAYREDYLPDDVIKQHENNVSELLAVYL